MRARASSNSRAGTRSSPRCCGIPHLVVCVNKMDLVDYSQAVLRADQARSSRSSRRGSTSHDVTFIPISALNGDNVVERSAQHALVRGPGAAGPPRARCTSRRDHNLTDCRFPVQWVIRPHRQRRHGLPRLCRAQSPPASSAPGDEVVVLPAGRTSTRHLGRHLRRPDGRGLSADVGHAAARRTTSDISRGDMICRPHEPSHGRSQDVRGDGLLDGRDALCARAAATRIKHTTRTVRAMVERLQLPDRRQHAASRRGRRRRST